MPLDGHPLTIEPRFPRASALSAIGVTAPVPDELDDAKIRNRFWSWRRRSDIVIFEHGGKIHWGIDPGVHHLGYDIDTLGCSDAWSLDNELRAQKTLQTLSSKRQYTHYMLTGMFLETSTRSGVTYLFRRLKPTVAMKATPSGEMRVLCCLCMHPIGYYSGSYAGAMVPTDDVLAHYMLMKGDEPMFWRRCNQHAAYRPEAGL